MRPHLTFWCRCGPKSQNESAAVSALPCCQGGCRGDLTSSLISSFVGCGDLYKEYGSCLACLQMQHMHLCNIMFCRRPCTSGVLANQPVTPRLFSFRQQPKIQKEVQNPTQFWRSKVRLLTATHGSPQARAAKEKKGEQDAPGTAFDSNCITPGTPFMARLQAHLSFFIRKKILEDPAWQKPQVILSGQPLHLCVHPYWLHSRGSP